MDAAFYVVALCMLWCVELCGAGCDGHGGPWGRRGRGRAVVVPQAGAAASLVTRQTDASAPTPDEVVSASGMFDKQ
jgi:hypothetical protein